MFACCLLLGVAGACSEASSVADAPSGMASSEAALSGAQCTYFAANGKTKICHATGSAKNPFVLINVSEAACVSAHAGHAHDYVAVNDPTCNGQGFLPPDAPCDGSVECSEGYTCRTGFCEPTDRCLGVTCTASDQCHASYCDSATGQCVDAAKVDGFTCTDGNACTQSDSCQAGRCVGANPVTCTASDQCHDAGTCDPSTGACSNPGSAPGTACNDGDACTTVDSCEAGTCIGASPVTCAALDQCHVAGSCDPASGTCSNPEAAPGTTCDDGDACTQVDSCEAGACVGASEVSCSALDQCHAAGACDPASGTCSNPALDDGTQCNDSDACTQVDSCQSGACVGSAPVTCAAPDACHLTGSCDPATGACSNPEAANGTACNDGNPCTTGDACAFGACSAGPTCLNGGTCSTSPTLTCSCPAGYVGADCGTVCGPGTSACNGTCLPTASDSNNCGGCGIVCGAGLACTGGACLPSCTSTNTTANCGTCGNACGVGQACTAGVCVNTQYTPPTCQSTNTCNACTQVAFTESWENGYGDWRAVGGGPITIASEAAPCAGHFLRETILYSGGRVFTRAGIPVTGGATYCVSSWIRSGVGTQPFLGINYSNAAGAIGEEHWLLGNPGYPNGYGGAVSPVTPDGTWRWHSNQFRMGTSVTHVVLKVEIFTAGAPGASDFDDIQLIKGPCPAPPASVCTAATCGP